MILILTYFFEKWEILKEKRSHKGLNLNKIDKIQVLTNDRDTKEYGENTQEKVEINVTQVWLNIRFFTFEDLPNYEIILGK